MSGQYPEAILFSIGAVTVYWYGVILAVAIIVGLFIAHKNFEKKQVSTDHLYNLLFLLIIFGLIGGRIGHIIGEWGYYAASPSSIIKIWEGGLAIHGVLSAGLLVVYFYTRIKKLSFWLVVDSMIIALPLMQSIGRWGNYFNQELFGKPTEVAWGIPIALANRPFEYAGYEFFHPLFFYESILMLLVFAIIYYLFRQDQFHFGHYTLLYFILFGVIRFSLDFLRIDMFQIGPLLLTQWISIVIIALAIYIWRSPKFKKTLAKK